MTPLGLFHQLRTLGVVLTPSPDGTLRYKAPKGTMNPALADWMRQHKAALHALVEACEERAAIMQYEGGLSREDAEWLAFVCVQGEARPIDHSAT